MEGVIDRTAAAFNRHSKLLSGRLAQEAKARAEDLIYFLLSEMDLLNADIARLHNDLSSQYGENYVDVFYEQHFANDDQELTRDEKLKKLETVYLDANGDIKPQYKDLNIAEFLMLQRQERELEQGIDRLKDANAEFERTGDITILQKSYKEASVYTIALERKQTSGPLVKEFSENTIISKVEVEPDNSTDLDALWAPPKV